MTEFQCRSPHEAMKTTMVAEAFGETRVQALQSKNSWLSFFFLRQIHLHTVEASYILRVWYKLLVTVEKPISAKTEAQW